MFRLLFKLAIVGWIISFCYPYVKNFFSDGREYAMDKVKEGKVKMEEWKKAKPKD